MCNGIDGWFAVLADCEPAGSIYEKRPRVACGEVFHSSGRPMLVGCWCGERLLEVRIKNMRVFLIGLFSVSSEELRQRLGSARRAEEVNRAVSGLAGSFYVIISGDDRVQIRGTISESRRVFRASVDGVAVGTSMAGLAARLAGAKLDENAIALQFSSLSSWSLAETTSWRDVYAVPGGSALNLTSAGRSEVTRWWSAPEPSQTLREGAEALRDGLRAAVTARVHSVNGVLAADLSGGLDSTSICFLAHEAGAGLVTTTIHWSAAGNEDGYWADLAASGLSGLERITYDSGQLPELFSDIGQRHHAIDEPSPVVRERSQLRVVSRDLAGVGAKLRLSGHGGDELTNPDVAHLAALVRRRPVKGFRELAAFRSRERWGAKETWQMLIDQQGYRAWLTRMARPASLVAARRFYPPGWEVPPELPPWATESAVALVSDILRSAADRASALHRTRSGHSRINTAMRGGRMAWQLAQAGAQMGLPVSSPFCDDAILEVCLRVRPDELRNSRTYKPLLKAAMRGIVPDLLLERETKDHSGVEWYRGLRSRRRELAELVDDSILVKLGFADAGRLRRALMNPDMHQVSVMTMESTLGLETWLRDTHAMSV
ncbi:asparagine synthase-related protein [Amycolatopsis japonica]|uniref:asparagine synthase-related protein n=1 Tax=Amycolatopsis japonica TaxID=208439 RepID=UPI0037B54600